MTESTNSTLVTLNVITDASGALWGLTPSTANGTQVTHNGIVDASTANALLLLYFNHTIYHENTAGRWYRSGTAGGWTLVATDPRLAPVESANGTTVTITGAALVDSLLESWTLVASATQGLQIAVNGAIDAVTSNVILLLYQNHRLYQENSAGGWWYKSKASDPWTLTSDPRIVPLPTPSPIPVPTPTPIPVPTPTPVPPTPTPTTGLSAPAQAAAAGFTHLVFADDFTTNTIDPVGGDASSSYKWFTYQTQTSGTHYSVMPTSTAASIANGNSGGGNFASSAGGLLKLMGHPSLSNNMQFFSVPTSRWATNGTAGTFQHGYMEAYVQYSASDSSAHGWPSWWSYATQLEATGGSTGTEIDFLEVDSSAYGGTVHVNGGGAASGTPIYRQARSSNWHVYGMLWKSTGSGIGEISMYIDNIKVGNTVKSGSGSSIAPLENNWLFLALGTGPGWPMYVDWVRVWQ